MRLNIRKACKPKVEADADWNTTAFAYFSSAKSIQEVGAAQGPFPIRSFTGDIGGKVPLGIGQGSLAILSFLPEEEREAIIRFNMPRILDKSAVDEVDLRILIDDVRRTGCSTFNFNMIDGMAGVGVPILDRNGEAVAAFSIGTLASRLTEKRLATVTDLLRKEAQVLSAKLNPFDTGLHTLNPALGGRV